MILPGNQLPPQASHEGLGSQRFQGTIAEYTTHQGHDTVLTPVLTAELRIPEKHAGITYLDFVQVSGEGSPSAPLGSFAGEPVLAEISMGEQGITKLTAVKVDADSSSEVRRYTDKLKYDFESPEDTYYLLALTEAGNGDKMVSGFTLISRGTNMGIIGRESNLRWLDGYGNKLEEGKSPIKNPSVSRIQCFVGYSEDGFKVTQQSGNTPTTVRTVATEQHKAVIGTNAQAQAEAEAQRLTVQKQRGTKLKGLLKRTVQ